MAFFQPVPVPVFRTGGDTDQAGHYLHLHLYLDGPCPELGQDAVHPLQYPDHPCLPLSIGLIFFERQNSARAYCRYQYTTG